MGDRETDPLEQIVFVADHLVRRARIGDAGNHFFQHDDTWLSHRFGFDTPDLSEFTAELLKRVQAVGEQLDLATPTLEMYLKALQEANRLLIERGMDAEDDIRLGEERSAYLQVLSAIAHLPAHSEAEIDLLSRTVDLIRTHFEIGWFLIVATDVSRQTVQGVLYTPELDSPQTFFRVLSVVESAPSAPRAPARRTLDLLGETVLSNGERVNLREEVLTVLQSGNLIAIPMSIDDHCHGECLIDSAGSKIRTPRHREHFSSLLDATAQLYERARLYRNIKRESESAAEALQRESEALRQLFHFERLASVGRLAAGAAHEINNPLAVISGKAQLLMMSESDKTKIEALNAIIDQSMRISKIISDLMGYARPAEPEVTDNHPRAMIENALYMAKHRLPDHQVETMIEVSEEVEVLKVDARQIEQVLVNLFVNAIQAMNGIGKLIVRAHGEEGTGMVAIQVTDTGPGIPPDDLNRIFDPFFTTKREGEGTGLGLAVSHRIIESHGGRMTVNSRLGEGTTFTVQLPSSGEGEAEIVQMPQVTARKPARRTGKRRILLVDDEKQLSDLIRDFLQDAGYVIEQASDGVEAMGLLESRVYDALIIDIRMPRKDGLEVLEELKGFTTGMPILVITGLASNEELDQATAFGASRILRKPFQLDELLHAVDELTKKRNAKLD
jgi:signal transduction histidine kinase/ActR/RegA family two-component response regulator